MLKLSPRKRLIISKAVIYTGFLILPLTPFAKENMRYAFLILCGIILASGILCSIIFARCDFCKRRLPLRGCGVKFCPYCGADLTETIDKEK